MDGPASVRRGQDGPRSDQGRSHTVHREKTGKSLWLPVAPQLRRMAEVEMANKTMKSGSGQTRDDTLAGYTATANQRTLADSAIDTLSKWEMSNLGSEVRQQTANNNQFSMPFFAKWLPELDSNQRPSD